MVRGVSKVHSSCVGILNIVQGCTEIIPGCEKLGENFVVLIFLHKFNLDSFYRSNELEMAINKFRSDEGLNPLACGSGL